MKTVKGKDVFKKGYKTWHVSGSVVSKFYAATNFEEVKKKYPKLNINPIFTDSHYEYEIIE